MPDARRHAARYAPASRRRQRRSQLRRPPDAFALGFASLEYRQQIFCTGTQFVQAVGAAEATLYYGNHPKALAQAKKAPLGQHVRHEPDEIVYVSAGDA